MTRYEAVLWDVGGVLLDVESVRHAHAAFVERFVDEFGADADPETALERWRGAVGEHFRSRDGTEFRSARDAYRRAAREVVPDVGEEDWFPLFRAASEEHLRANDGAREVLAALASAGVYQGVLSDVDAEEGEFILSHLGLREYLDDVTTSEAVGRTKPDRAMYEAALSKSPHPADRTIMVGDRYDHDCAGAADAGVHPVAFGADDGPAVEHRVTSLRQVPDVVGVGPPATEER